MLLKHEPGRSDQEDKFSLETCFRQTGLDLSGRTYEKRFMQFGDFLRDAEYASGSESDDDFVDKFVDAVTALVKSQRVIEVGILLKERGPGGGFGRQKSGEPCALN